MSADQVIPGQENLHVISSVVYRIQGLHARSKAVLHALGCVAQKIDLAMSASL